MEITHIYVYYLQQKKHTKDPVELHYVKQRDGKSTEAFIERFINESLLEKGAPSAREYPDSCMESTNLVW